MSGVEELPTKTLMYWNNEEFWVMDEPTCWKTYDLDGQGIETYYPELLDDPELRNEIPWDVVNREHVLQLQGMDLTLQIFFLSDIATPFIPQRLEAGSSEIGVYKGGAMVAHDGTRIKIRVCRAEPTETSDREEFEAHERARQDIPLPSPTESPTDRLRQDIRLQSLESTLASDLRDLANQYMASFPSLTFEELFAGTLHMKGVTWAEMVNKCKLAKGTLSKRINQFYIKTGLPKPDRLAEKKGSRVSFDAARDGEWDTDRGIDEDEDEHSEHY